MNKEMHTRNYDDGNCVNLHILSTLLFDLILLLHFIRSISFASISRFSFFVVFFPHTPLILEFAVLIPMCWFLVISPVEKENIRRRHRERMRKEMNCSMGQNEKNRCVNYRSLAMFLFFKTFLFDT